MLSAVFRPTFTAILLPLVACCLGPWQSARSLEVSPGLMQPETFIHSLHLIGRVHALARKEVMEIVYALMLTEPFGTLAIYTIILLLLVMAVVIRSLYEEQKIEEQPNAERQGNMDASQWGFYSKQNS